MSDSTPVIRVATAQELPRAVAVIVAAFVGDPPARFAWPSAFDYLQAMPVATGEFAKCCVERGTAYVAGDFRGVALWLPPGASPGEDAIDQLFRRTAKPEHLDDLLTTFERMGQSHPSEPHWYLPQVGVDPMAQGEGLGARLMEYALVRCDLEHAPAYLEASKPRNVTFYERFGFEVVSEIQVGAGPPITPMVRRAR